MLLFREAAVRRADDKDGIDEEGITLIGVSKGGNAYRPVVTAGRVLLPEDERAIVLNQDIAREMGVSVGDDVVIENNDDDTVWTVVGLLFDINNDQTASAVWLDVLSRELNQLGRGETLFVGIETRDGASLDSLARDLRKWLDRSGKDVGSL